MTSFDIIAFDADDTLWHYERLYVAAQANIAKLLAPYGNSEEIDAHLYRVELGNIQLYGYGIKGFALSMIEAAIGFSEGRISGSEIHTLIGYAREMLTAKIQLLEHVTETISGLSPRYRLMIFTKGDLYEQETKISCSGLGQYF